MGIIYDISGIADGNLQLGIGGPRIKNNSGVVSALNAGETDFTSVEVKDIGASGIIYAPTLYVIGPSSNSSASGIIFEFTAGENLSFGDICYIKSDGKLWKADANAAGKYPAKFMAFAAISADASGNFLRLGIARNDSWSWTVGGKDGIIYLSTTVGGMTQTQPSATDDVIQILGVALSATTVFFDPSPDYMTHT